jgi:predicted phage baseplate assembly protein
MPLPDIQLDDRTFDDLKADMLRRIPGYTGEWTDFNESDPGITLMELFCSLVEMVIWRLNRVPDKNYMKFLELIGLQLNPPTPAKAELTFTLSSNQLKGAVLIPQGTQVALVGDVDGGPVIFETDDNLYAVPGSLTALQSFDSTQFALLNESNRVDGKFYYVFGPTPQVNSALYLGFDQAFPTGEFPLTFHAYTDDLIDEGQGVSATTTAALPPVVAAWEYWAGDSGNWKPLTIISDTTAALTSTGVIKFQAPTDQAAKKLGLLTNDSDNALFWFRYRIVQVLGAGYEIPPRLEDVVINTIGATNIVTVINELLGAATGMPDQKVQLSNTPVIAGTLSLEVDEGSGFVAWTEVTDFAASTRTDLHYTLDLTTGTVSFGNGQKGKIPLPLPDGSANIRAATYKWGGGARGNGGANTITSLQSALPFVANVTNLQAAEGGKDEEKIDEIKKRAPLALHTQNRAVSAGDFEFLATQTPSARVRRAKALPLRNPNFELERATTPGAPATLTPVPGAVTVIVVPDSILPQPMPTEATLAAVGAYLNNFRLITTELYVIAPKYRLVEIDAQVIASPNVSSGDLTQTLTQKLLDYFNPLIGGPSGTGWDFGGTLYFSAVFGLVLNTPGVLRMEAGHLTVYVDGKPIPGGSDVAIQPDELIYSTQHNIQVSYS